jgi:hypothetical protein
MNLKRYWLFGCFITWGFFAQVQAPHQFLPHYGKHVSYYHHVEDYFEHLVKNSNQIQHQVYGKTYQDRNLNVYFISSEENLKNIETIRKQHLTNIGLLPGSKTRQDKAFVWLSFNVHGNEIGSIESALSVAYELVNPNNAATKKWLQDVIVILDPCLNPDGFARYSHWLRDITGTQLHPGVTDREHMEPWPGGRQNHYVNDLNRDWAWQTQKESQLRIALYQKWMPMVHADVHEMGYNEPYFFPPAAEPFHEQITAYQRKFHQKIGELTSKKFDEKGWLYYSGERFDLFYPSYGDTYPSYNGAIGMTYEQGGIGAGRAVRQNNGQILTIQDRLEHHTKAILAAVELSYLERNNLIQEFHQYFIKSRSQPLGNFKSYVVKNSPKVEGLLQLLQKNKIEYQVANQNVSLKGWHYQTGKEANFQLQPNDVVISVDQPRAVLTQVLMEPNHKLTDSLSYDITAWALPFAYGVETYGVKSFLKVAANDNTILEKTIKPAKFYAVAIPWNNVVSAKILGALHQKQIKVRCLQKSINFDGKSFEKGTLIVTKADNLSVENLELLVQEMTKDKLDVAYLQTGFGGKGGDIGGELYPFLASPKILLLGGLGVSNVDFGQIWHFLDERVYYPHSKVELAYFNRINFQDFNTVILTEGWYNLSDSQRKTLDEFVQKGGKIIAIGSALRLFEDREGYRLTKFAEEETANQQSKKRKERELKSRFDEFDSQERRSISNEVTGAILENVVDDSHPLGFGLGKQYFSLKTSNQSFQLLKGAQNVMYIPKKYQSHGFIGAEIKSKLSENFTIAVDEVGRGKVVYMVDNPMFRGFWENGNLLFSNAIFMGF